MTLSSFSEKVYAYINENSLISPGQSILLSLSAGKDSMAMLHVLLELSEVLQIKQMAVFHLNHLMRASESDLDYEFVREITESNKLPFLGKTYDFSKDSHGRSFEEYARDVRYSMLKEAAFEGGYDLIATAHNLEDNAETLLMRLFQGSGIIGLRGILPKRDNIIRPLRSSSISEIKDYLKSKNINWREDASNADIHYKRNYVRLNILPHIVSRFPLYADALHELSSMSNKYMKLTDSLIAERFGEELIKHEADGSFSIASYMIDKDQDIMYHVLARAIREFGLFVKTSMLNEIWRNYNTSKQNYVTLYENKLVLIKKHIVSGKTCILLQKPTELKEDETLSWEYNIRLNNDKTTVSIKETGLTLSIEKCSFTDFLNSKNDELFVSIPQAESEIVLRNRRNGDRIKLEAGTKKIKDILIEKKLSSKDKNMIPLLIINSHVAAIMTGFETKEHNRIAKGFLVSENSERILCVKKIPLDSN